MMKKLKITKLRLEGTYVVEPNPFVDTRGVFSRYFCKRELKNIINDREIVNINYSKNYKKGAVRGLHYQTPPYSEMKMPRCISGKVLDIFVGAKKKLVIIRNGDHSLSDKKPLKKIIKELNKIVLNII